MAQIRYLRNDIRGAVAHLDSIPSQPPYVTFEVYATHHVWRALCDVAMGHVESALERLEAACAQAADRKLPHLAILADAVRRDLQYTRAEQFSGRSPPARSDPSQGAGRSVSDEALPWFTRAWLARATITALVARERYAEATRVAEAFVAATADSSRRLLKAEAWLLVARACAPSESRTRQNAVDRALQLTAGTGALRLFLDAGTEVIEGVCECARAGAGPVAEWAQQIVTRLTPLDRLTSRQRAVLQELCKGQSNKEIARVLQLSPETVKWYLKGIFEHSGLSTREEVVRAAARGTKPPDVPPAPSRSA
jgi:LuxR family maltose regulon positive regulatory protein